MPADHPAIQAGIDAAAHGDMVIDSTLPASPAGPYEIPMQALVGAELTNLFVLEVKILNDRLEAIRFFWRGKFIDWKVFRKRVDFRQPEEPHERVP